MGDMAEVAADEAMRWAYESELCERGHRYLPGPHGCPQCEMENEEPEAAVLAALARDQNQEGEMYVYRVTIIVENEAGQRQRLTYNAKASRMGLAIARAVDYDPRLNTGKQGQDVGILARKLGRLADHPQGSDVRPTGGDR